MHVHGRRQPQLNFNVLRLVCNCLTNVSDILSFSLTCSTLKEGAFRRRLMMSAVVLSDASSVERFYSFIFADVAGRAPFIFGLDLARFRLNGLEDRLVAILEAAIHLEYLHLSTTIGDHVFAVAEKFTSLRELNVHGDGSNLGHDALRQFLISLRSPLQHIRIDDYGREGISASFLHDDLVHFAPTLRILELDKFHLDLFPADMTTAFAAVRSPVIDNTCSFMPQRSTPAEILWRLFPNLDNAFEIVLSPTVYADFQGDSLQGLRERSKEAQKAFSWSSLDHIICDARSAFLMALQCLIRRMDISIWLPQGWQYLMETLRHNCPQQLYFSFDAGLFPLTGPFPLEAEEKLTHLVTFVSTDVRRPNPPGGPIDLPWTSFITSLIDPIEHLRLTHLRIVLSYRLLHYMSPRTPRRDDILLDVEFLSTVLPSESDLLPAATRFFEAMPTLQYVFLTVCHRTVVGQWSGHYSHLNSPWHSSKAWRAVEVDEDVHLSGTMNDPCMELDSEAASTIMDREGLQLRPTDEYSIQQCSAI